ncbi:damage-inducible protein DinB [Rhodopseudomonas palustris]|uniref:Damage-inducible protein DinB n=1 Tax=Rhodopseudomonas palustris TaxID=1076 RepID=A0A323UTM7_RHOPL|nr:DinB family protein [Rhodopseudomonas palustris]PZA10898.1 damage-inducible protein DinB [Rhodopseudomonas palustris]
MDRRHFAQFAAYNRWANARLYQAALALPDEAYRRSVGVFFGSLHGTLNHLLVADRIWLKRLTGEGEPPTRLDVILFDDLRELARARAAEDERIVRMIDGHDAAAFAEVVDYSNTSGKSFSQPRAAILSHFFNHQTHHRGQAHACLSILTGAEPPSLDLMSFQRGMPAPDLARLVA